MILSFIEVAGFRGFRNRTRVDLASGFTIISGPNGVGKSSLFDAVEYLLIGKLTKYGEDKAAGEAAEDYVWTVGDPAPQSCFVSLGFTDPAGTCFEVTRTRESGLSLKTDGSRKLLGIDDEGPDPGLELLSRTSIIRDEFIPGMSLELPERERFQFVSTAIGSIAAEENVERAKDILLSAEAIAASADREYSALREKLSEAIENWVRPRRPPRARPTFPQRSNVFGMYCQRGRVATLATSAHSAQASCRNRSYWRS